MSSIPVLFLVYAGDGSDECSARAEDVLTGKNYIGADTNDDPGPGSMADNGAQASTLGPGGSVTIKKGYHNGSGKISTTTLAAETQATAAAAFIRSGYTAWVNGVKITGTMTSLYW